MTDKDRNKILRILREGGHKTPANLFMEYDELREKAAKVYESTIIDLQERVNYLAGRDLELIKRETSEMNVPGMTTAQIERYQQETTKYIEVIKRAHP